MSSVRGLMLASASGLVADAATQTMMVLSRPDCRILKILETNARRGRPWSRVHKYLKAKLHSASLPPQHLVMAASILDGLPMYYPAAAAATLDVILSRNGQVLWLAIVLSDKRVLALISWDWVSEYLGEHNPRLSERQVNEHGPAGCMVHPMMSSHLPPANVYIFFDFHCGEGARSRDHQDDVDYELTDVITTVGEFGPGQKVISAPGFGEQPDNGIHAIACCLATWGLCPPGEKIAK